MAGLVAVNAALVHHVVGLVALGFVTWRARKEASAKADGWPGWVLCSASLGAFVLRDVTEFGSSVLWRLVSAVLAVVAGGIAFGALHLLSEEGSPKFQSIREAIEGVLIAGGVCVTAWVVFLGDLVEASDLGSVDKFLLVASPVGAAAVAAYAVQIVLRTPPGGRTSLMSYAGGTAAIFVAEALVAVDRLQPGAPNGRQLVTLVFSMLGYAMFALGATRPTTVPQTRLLAGRRSRLRWTLWLLPSSTALAFALSRLRPGVADPTLLTIAGALIAVHLAHQWFTVVENHRLVVDLDRRVAERTSELAAREVYYRGLFEHSTDVVAVVGPDYRFRDHTPSLRTVLGWRPEDLDNIRVDDLLAGLGAFDALDAYRRIFDDNSRFEAVHDRLLHTDGTWRDVEIHLANHLDDPVVQGVIATTRDITDRRRLETELLHQAFHDPLTGLANRALFRTTLERSVEIAAAHRHTVAVLLLDLDGFKAVNDTLGHSAGDQVLRIFADRMRGIVRVEDTLARLGGDEFAILVEPGADPGFVAKRVVAELSQPVVLDGNLLELSASVGIADTRHALTVDDLLRNADVAMYAAKQDPKNGSVRFDPSMHERSARRLQLLSDLRGAIERNEFEVWLQPIVHLADGTARGFEALVRWAHPTEGILYPGDFVPIAEESGLIDVIGDMVLRRAVTEAAPTLKDNGWYVSVNVSTRQLDSTQLLVTVQELLRTTGLPPEQLVLEITESAVMSDPETALIRLERLSRLGVRIALDDFGTGYSSLGVLSKFPFTLLKVDRTFVRALHDDAASATALLSAIDEIGRALDLTIVAEGIETDDERSSLLALGYAYGQGFMFSRAIPAADALRAASAPFIAAPAPV